MNRVSGGEPGSGSARQAASPPTASAPATAVGIDRPGGVTPLRPEHLRDEVAEDGRGAVGDEVDLARRAALGREPQAVDDIVDMRRVRALAPTADPGEPARADHLGELRAAA